MIQNTINTQSLAQSKHWMSGVALAVFPIAHLHMASFGAGLLKICQPLKLLILLIGCSYLCCTLCQAITSRKIGEIRLNLPQARGSDQQGLIQLYWCLLCFQSECCTGRGLRDPCPVIPLAPPKFTGEEPEAWRGTGEGLGGTQVLFHVSNPTRSRLPEICPRWDCLNACVGAAITPAKDVSEQIRSRARESESQYNVNISPL